MTNDNYPGLSKANTDIIVEPFDMAEYPYLVKAMTQWGPSDGTAHATDPYATDPEYTFTQQQEGPNGWARIYVKNT